MVTSISPPVISMVISALGSVVRPDRSKLPDVGAPSPWEASSGISVLSRKDSASASWERASFQASPAVGSPPQADSTRAPAAAIEARPITRTGREAGRTAFIGCGAFITGSILSSACGAHGPCRHSWFRVCLRPYPSAAGPHSRVTCAARWVGFTRSPAAKSLWRRVPSA